jgi:hypothetical protein
MRKAVLVAFFLVTACARQQGMDELSIARRQLHNVRCGAEPSIAGVAGVHPHDPHAALLGDWIIVSICHLDTLTTQAETAQQPLALFIDGQDFDNPPAGIDFESGQVTFILGRNARNKHHWNPLLYNPLFDPVVSLRVGAGIHEGRPLPRATDANTTIRLKKLDIAWTTVILLLLLLIIAIALVLYARNSDLVRDGPTIAGVRQPYSVARVQMAWWFFLILIGFSFIWMVTGDNDTITPALLGLMGISAATAVAAVAIGPADARSNARRKIIDDEIAAIGKVIDQIDIDIAANAGALGDILKRRRAEQEARRAALIAERAGIGAVPRSKGFWRDLVTDDCGAVALDRFQIVAWTLVLGGVFVTDVILDLSMPEFSATTLALMGISSGTYIGFKLPGRAPSSSP